MKTDEVRTRSQDVYGIIEQNKEKIIELIDGIVLKDGMEITSLELKEKKGLRKQCKFLSGEIGYKVRIAELPEEQRKVRFFVKYFPHPKRNIPNMQLERQFYDLMRDSGAVPRAYKLEGLEDVLLLEHVGDSILETRLMGARKKDKTEILRNSIDVLVSFEVHALETFPAVIDNPNILRWLYKIRRKPPYESLERYLASFDSSEEYPEFQEDVEDGYLPVLEVMSKGGRRQIIHGDAGAHNFCSGNGWEPKNIKIVDMAGLTIGSPFFDLAQMITSPAVGFGPKEWNYFIGYYAGKEMGCLGAEKEVRVFGIDLSRLLKTKISLSEEAIRNARTQFYAATIHHSFRRLAKMRYHREIDPEQYESWLQSRPALKDSEQEMKRNIQLALDYICKKKSYFDFDSSDLKMLDGLRSAFERNGISN